MKQPTECKTPVCHSVVDLSTVLSLTNVMASARKIAHRIAMLYEGTGALCSDA